MTQRKSLPTFQNRLLFVGRFTYILVALVLLLALFPFLEGDPTSFIIVRILFSVVLWLALIISGGRRWTLFVAVFLFLPAILVHWINFAFASFPLALADGCLAVLVYLVIAGTILGSIFRTRNVTYETIGGALCVYLLIGLVGAGIFALLELIHPGSFRLPESLNPDRAHFIFGDEGYSQFVYYSYATLTTLGIGDIVPLTDAARTFTYVEAVAGQFFLAVLVARLVGLHIAQPTREDSKEALI